MLRRSLLITFGVILQTIVNAQCAFDTWRHLIYSDDFYLEAESAAGAKGDVVPVTMFFNSRLLVNDMVGLRVAICHDPEVAEVVGEPIYSEELLSMLLFTGPWFTSIDEGSGQSGNPKGNGIFIDFILNRDAYNARFPSEDPLPLMTVFYRLKGTPGNTGEISFCDSTLQRFNARCTANLLSNLPDGNVLGLYFLSTNHQGGKLTIVDGPATHPDRPPAPPEAKTYPERPSPEAANFQVRITGGLARPGDREVPVKVYARADVEYAAIQIPIDFDERYLRLSRSERNFPFGFILVNNQDLIPGGGPEEGNVVSTTGLQSSKRRIAAEGEEILVATLYFDVLPSAAEIDSTSLEVARVLGGDNHLPFDPMIIVWTTERLTGFETTVRAELEPISISRGVLAIRRSLETLVGDANLDGSLDISDALAVLGHLFLGEPEPLCPTAADFDRNGALEITDPIALLGALFLGVPPLDPMEAPCRE